MREYIRQCRYNILSNCCRGGGEGSTQLLDVVSDSENPMSRTVMLTQDQETVQRADKTKNNIIVTSQNNINNSAGARKEPFIMIVAAKVIAAHVIVIVALIMEMLAFMLGGRHVQEEQDVNHGTSVRLLIFLETSQTCKFCCLQAMSFSPGL